MKQQKILSQLVYQKVFRSGVIYKGDSINTYPVISLWTSRVQAKANFTVDGKW